MLNPESTAEEEEEEELEGDGSRALELCASEITEASEKIMLPRGQRLSGAVLGNDKFACFFLNCTNRSDKGTEPGLAIG